MRNGKTVKKDVWRYRRSRGAISVFLTIILVPCIITACLFDDVCRVQLSQAVSASAADLALQSLLANYDKKLEQKYGILGSVQDMGDSYYDKAEGYYNGMMNAGSSAGSDLVYAYIKSKLSGDVTDLLQVEAVEAAEISALSDGSLENPALLEDAIVEFIKYRGLPELGSRLIDIASRVTASDFLNSLDGSDEDKQIMEDKQAYGEAESELLEEALYTYIAIHEYEKSFQNDHFPTAEEYKAIEEKLPKIQNDLKKVTDLITKYYAEAEGVTLVSFPTFNYWDDPNRETYYKEYYGDDKVVSGVTKYYLSKNTFTNFTNTFNTDFVKDSDAVTDAARSIVTACSQHTFTANQTNPAIYCKRIMVEINKPNSGIEILRQKADTMFEWYKKCEGLLKCEEDPEAADDAKLPYDWKTTLENYKASIKAVWSAYYRSDYASGDGDAQSTYNKLRKTYYDQAQAANTVNMVNNHSYTFSSEAFGGDLTIDGFSTKAKEYISNYIEKMNKSIELLNRAINGGKINVGGKEVKAVSLEKLKELVTARDDALTNWRNSSNAGGSAYAQQDQELVKKIDTGDYGSDSAQSQSEEMVKHIDAESVDNLSARLTNIKSDVENVKQKINEITFGGIKISELNGVGTYRDVSVGAAYIPSEHLSQAPTLQQNESDAARYAAELIKPEESELYRFTGFTAGEAGDDSDLAHDTPALYEYLTSQFEGHEEDAVKKVDGARNLLKKFSDKAKEMKENAALFSLIAPMTEEAGTGNIGEGNVTDGTFGALTAIGAFLSIVKNIVDEDTNAATEFRDQVYTAEYAMDMLTLATTNNEGRYRLANESGAVSASKYDFKSVAPDWGNGSKTEVYNDQSLTNYALNKDNNALCLGEIEYLLYAKSDVASNDKEAFKTVFAIREIVDLVSGFILYWGQKNTTGRTINLLANAIAGATYGIVPAFLVKTGVIMALGTLEACNDLIYLKKGVPVTAYKSKAEQWVYSLDYEYGNDFESANIPDPSESSDENKKPPEDENGLYYSDYMYFFLLMLTQSNHEQVIKRIGNLIEANMQSEESGFKLDKAQCYFMISGKMQVKPLMLALPIANSDPDIDVAGFRSNAVWCQYNVKEIKGYS